MRIAVASGKGGTGKTVIATSLAWLLAREGHRVTYVDADVEEPNGHLFLHPTLTRRQRFGVIVPAPSGETCSGCGECQRFCAYHAIIALRDRVMLFPELCHGCGGCLLVCPDGALVEVRRETGTIESGNVRGSHGLRFHSATLDVGEAMATPLISCLLEGVSGDGIVVVDAPPGTSCSAMAAIKDADIVLLVTEPTPFGLHDLQQAVEMCRALGHRVAAVINRSDLGDDRVRGYLDSECIPILAEIEYMADVARAYARGSIAARACSSFRERVARVREGLVKETVS